MNVFAQVSLKKIVFLFCATGPDLPLVYLGAKTGRDGIGGATMASNEFNSKKEKERPTVQIGTLLWKMPVRSLFKLMLMEQ